MTAFTFGVFFNGIEWYLFVSSSSDKTFKFFDVTEVHHFVFKLSTIEHNFFLLSHLINVFLKQVPYDKVVNLWPSSSISSYSSSQLLFSSVLLQRKSQGSIETEQDNFSSQSQSSRPYTTVESLKEYFGERREPQYSLSPSISGFHCWTVKIFFPDVEINNIFEVQLCLFLTLERHKHIW